MERIRRVSRTSRHERKGINIDGALKPGDCLWLKTIDDTRFIFVMQSDADDAGNLHPPIGTLVGELNIPQDKDTLKGVQLYGATDHSGTNLSNILEVGMRAEFFLVNGNAISTAPLKSIKIVRRYK